MKNLLNNLPEAMFLVITVQFRVLNEFSRFKSPNGEGIIRAHHYFFIAAAVLTIEWMALA